METGTKPELSVSDSGALVLPPIQTGLSVLDTMVQKAWLGQYNSTAHILKDADTLHCNISRDVSGIAPRALPRELLRDHVRHWREHREKYLGNPILNCHPSFIFFWLDFIGCVLRALPTEDELASLADHYGWDKDEGLRFSNHKVS
jgi:hypothetical protein